MIPLRLRKRRDGTLCLTDATGAVESPDREFPPEHVFSAGWLLANTSNGVAVTDDEITLNFANAKGVYRITEQEGNQITAELVSTELFDPPTIDEDAAAAIAAAKTESEG